MPFFEPINRRRIIPWLGAYLAGGFLALEGVDQLIGNDRENRAIEGLGKCEEVPKSGEDRNLLGQNPTHSLALEEEANLVEQAVEDVLGEGHRTADIAAGAPSLGTREMGGLVVEKLGNS